MSAFKVLLEDEGEYNLFLAAVESSKLNSRKDIEFKSGEYEHRKGWFTATLTATSDDADRALREALYVGNLFAPWRGGNVGIIEV